MPSKKIPQLQHSRKFVKEENSAIVRQTSMITGDSYISWRMSHLEHYITKSEVMLKH